MVSRYTKQVSIINKVRIGIIGSASALEPERTHKILCTDALLELPHIEIDANVSMTIYRSSPGTVASETTELLENKRTNTNKININLKESIFGKIAGLSEQPTIKIISMTLGGGNDIENNFLSKIKKCHIIIIIASGDDINNMMRSCKHTFLDIDYIIRNIVNSCNCYNYRAKIFIVATNNMNVPINLSECNILNNAPMCNIANIKSKIVETITADIQLILMKNINLKREKLYQNVLQRQFIPIITAAYLDYMSYILDCDTYLNTNINLDLDGYSKSNNETPGEICICCCSIIIVLIILAVAMFIIFQI